MNISIKEIRAFVAVARHGAVTSAAGRLHRSQPAITRRIRLLEQELGSALLERVRGRMILTEAGKAFLPYAEKVLSALDDGSAAVLDSKKQAQSEICLAIVGTLASSSIATKLKEFLKAHPHILLQLRTGNSRNVGQLVKSAEATLGMRYFEDPSPELVSLTVAHEPMIVVCPPDHKLAGRTIAEPEELRGETWVAFPNSGASAKRDPYTSRFFEQLSACALADAEIVPVDSLTAQKRLVELGFGVALVPETSVQEELRLGSLRVVRSQALEMNIPVCLIYRKNRFLSADIQGLIDHIFAISGASDAAGAVTS